jgi:hypothetical protein
MKSNYPEEDISPSINHNEITKKQLSNFYKQLRDTQDTLLSNSISLIVKQTTIYQALTKLFFDQQVTIHQLNLQKNCLYFEELTEIYFIFLNKTIQHYSITNDPWIIIWKIIKNGL